MTQVQELTAAVDEVAVVALLIGFELAVTANRGSMVQVEEQPSPLLILPSSHSSPNDPASCRKTTPAPDGTACGGGVCSGGQCVPVDMGATSSGSSGCAFAGAPVCAPLPLFFLLITRRMKRCAKR
jgi:hypothetical protein